MRAYEFITESKTGSLQDDVASALPASYAIPALKNQDPYLQYRFSVAIAGAKGRKQRLEDNVPPFYKESAWGENEIIVSFDPNMEEWLNDALSQMGIKNGLKRISTMNSEESKDIDKISPVVGFRGFSK